MAPRDDGLEAQTDRGVEDSDSEDGGERAICLGPLASRIVGKAGVERRTGKRIAEDKNREIDVPSRGAQPQIIRGEWYDPEYKRPAAFARILLQRARGGGVLPVVASARDGHDRHVPLLTLRLTEQRAV
jgi:hypothetical protein